MANLDVFRMLYILLYLIVCETEERWDDNDSCYVIWIPLGGLNGLQTGMYIVLGL